MTLPAAFDPVVKQLTDALNDALADRAKGRGRPTRMQQQRVESLQKSLGFVQVKKLDLAEKIAKRESWLTFHYADATHRFTAIRLRNPFETEKNFAFVSYNPYRAFGLFGLQMFPRSNAQVPIEKLIVTEGEFNSLQLQSLLVRFGETEGKKFTYLYCASVGSVNQADYSAIHQVSADPILLYDNDSDKDNAGFALVSKAQEFMAIEAATTPNGTSDIDEFILQFNSNQEAWGAVQEMLEDREWFYRHFASLAVEILEARDVKKKEHRINDRVKNIILEDLLVRGTLYHDEITAYFFKRKEKKLLEVSPHDHEFVLLLAKYGINAAEKISRYIIEGLRNAAFHEGPRIHAHKFSHYNPDNFTLYVHNYNSQMYRITTDSVDLVDNGTDGVLFLTDPNAEPFLTDFRWFQKEYKKVKDNPDVLASDSYFLKLIVEPINFAKGILTPKERGILLILWVYCNFFREINKTRPLLAWVGEKGSGKSFANRKLGIVLFGSEFQVTLLPQKCEDFDVIITNRPFVCVDNADTKRPWFENRLSTAATGGKIPRRRLYTTNTLVDFNVDCFVSITSRTPEFRRDDVADRLLMMTCQRYEKFLPENRLVAEVLKMRDQIWVELIFRLQNVVQALKQYAGENFSGAFRMADFADFSLKIAKKAGFSEELTEIFKKLTQEQNEFTLQDEPIVDLLEHWVARNAGNRVNSAQLFAELRVISDQERIQFDCKNVRSFAQKLKHLVSNLRQFYDIKVGEDRTKRKTYVFQKKQE